MVRAQQKHGLTSNGVKHPIYKLRERLMQYCYSIKENNRNYPYYKGKGIKVCDEWKNDILKFYHWCLDNGWKKGLSIDRIDSNGNYEPSNCRFVTKSENSIKARSENNQSGNKASSAKLSDDQVMAIKLLLRLGYSVSRIANFFGMGLSAIWAINNRKTWKHIKEI
jgi:hypothetical protein